MSAVLSAKDRAIRRKAAEWLAVAGVRTLTLKEQADLAEWRDADPRHKELYDALRESWGRFDALSEFPHSVDRSPDPDLFRPARAARRIRPVMASLAAAACVAFGAYLWIGQAPQPLVVIPAVEVPMRLADGTVVDLNAGADVRERYTRSERRVELLRGEALFTVARDATRPFVVMAKGVAIRAVGTAFNVRLGKGDVAVLVTEGSVAVGVPRPVLRERDNPLPAPAPGVTAAAEVVLKAGERAVVSTGEPVAAEAPPRVETVGPAEMDRQLAWQLVRFTFDRTSLAEVVERCNAGAAPGAPTIEFGDPALRDIRVSGRIRTDDIEAVVEVLETTFGIEADRSRSTKIILRGKENHR